VSIRGSVTTNDSAPTQLTPASVHHSRPQIGAGLVDPVPSNQRLLECVLDDLFCTFPRVDQTDR
jgi:hypothetical protein